MENEERNKLYNEQTDDIYRAIGKFNVRFEQLVFYMGEGISSFLSKNGLNNQQLSNIILADQTAYPIKTMFGAMIFEIVDLNDNERRIVKNILKQVQDLIDRRNDIVHCTWFVGWTSPSDNNFSDVTGRKLKRGNSGAEVKGFDLTRADFDQLSNDCDSVTTLVNRLWSVITSERRIDNNFYFNDCGVLVGEPILELGS